MAAAVAVAAAWVTATAAVVATVVAAATTAAVVATAKGHWEAAWTEIAHLRCFGTFGHFGCFWTNVGTVFDNLFGLLLDNCRAMFMLSYDSYGVPMVSYGNLLCSCGVLFGIRWRLLMMS